MDPLRLLRKFAMEQDLRRVTRHAGKIDFGDDYSFSEDTPVPWRKSGKPGEFYSLLCVYYFLQNRKVAHTEYMKQATSARVPTVTIVDRRELEQYLTGKIDNAASIASVDELPVLRLRSAAAEAGDGPTADPSLEPKSKRPRVADSRQDGMPQGAPLPPEASAPTDEGLGIDKIFAQERQLRDRNTMLRVHGRDFSRCFQLVADVMQELRHKERQSDLAAQKRKEPVGPRPIPVRPSGRFERELPENRVKTMAGKEFANVEVSLYGYKGRETEAQRNGVPGVPQPAWQHGHAQYAQQAAGGHAARHQHRRNESHTGHVQKQKNGDSHQPPVGGIPIILIPQGLSAKINMYNAKQLFQYGTYKSPEQCRAEGVKKLDSVVVERKMDRKRPIQYQITDKAPQKNSKDWARVIGCIAQGVKWQFKEWPFEGAAEGNLSRLFEQVCGFYIAYDNEDTNDFVKTWNVKVLTVHRENRHSDVTVLNDFFQQLDDFMERMGNKNGIKY